MTPLRFLLAFVFLGTRSFFQKSLKGLVLPLVALIVARFEQILWERFENIFKGHNKSE